MTGHGKPAIDRITLKQKQHGIELTLVEIVGLYSVLHQHEHRRTTTILILINCYTCDFSYSVKMLLTSIRNVQTQPQNIMYKNYIIA